MNQSLSIVLPVHNVEATLARQVQDLLDTLTDWRARFEIVIVDDGSTDQTPECARDLAREFPQLRVLRHSRRLGSGAAIHAGLKHSLGDVVCVHDATAETRGIPRALTST